MENKKTAIIFIALWGLIFILTKNFAISMISLPLVIQNLVMNKLKDIVSSVDRFFVETYQAAVPFLVVVLCAKEKFELWAGYPSKEQLVFAVAASIGWALFIQIPLALIRREEKK